ncbi:MAG TPA: hypothetical protein VHT05_01410 [Candidatus Elarobacter sp.]|jgi:hypothetical protein|nr:hypothetical protein [Candidatus Elarobacter sp.]
MPATDRVWRFDTSTRVIIGIAAGFMYGFAVLLFCLPLITGVNDPAGNVAVAATGLIMLGFGAFMTFGYVAVDRTRIRVTATELDATVPSHHSRLLVPHFRAIALPLAQIASVERRQEAFRSFGLVNMRDSLSIVTTAGERIGIFSNTRGPASTLPLDEIADAIAAGAGTTVTDAGTVWTKAPGLYGEAASSWTEPRLDDPHAAKARRMAARTAAAFVILFTLVIVVRACT